MRCGLLRPYRKRHSRPDAAPNVAAAFDYETVSALHELISLNAEALVCPKRPDSETADTDEEKGAAVANVSHLMAKLQQWKVSLMPGMAQSFKKFYSAQQLYYCIDVAMHAKAGSQGFRDICIRALRALFPHMHEDVWLSSYVSKLPAASTITRHMVSLEVAILLLEREVAKMSPVPRVRYALVDSSPAWGLEWLWVQEVSVPGGQPLIDLFNDCVNWVLGFEEWKKKRQRQRWQVMETSTSCDTALQMAARSSRYQQTASHVAAKSKQSSASVSYPSTQVMETALHMAAKSEDLSTEFIEHDEDGMFGLQASSIPQTFHYQLQSIASRLQVHTYTPVVLGSGFSNLSHKLSGCLHCFFCI